MYNKITRNTRGWSEIVYKSFLTKGSKEAECYISQLKFLYALLFNSCSSSSCLRFTSFFASMDVTMDTMMKSNTSQTVMTDAPSNKPRKPPTCKNGNRLHCYMHGKCQLLLCALCVPSTQVGFNSSYCLHCLSNLRVCRTLIENLK